MPSKTSQTPSPSTRLHPRNRHQGRYDFKALGKINPDLVGFMIPGKEGGTTLDFTNPKAVKALNRALLEQHYGIRDWDIPEGFLCPPIPGRADYIHTLADLLGESHDGHIPRGPGLIGLDIGTGANAVYPLIGNREYRWRFVGSDINQQALDNAHRIVRANPVLGGQISLRLQPDADQVFRNLIAADERFDFTVCNPPFHASADAARQQSRRRWDNLESKAGLSITPHQSFGGQANELYCEGGEAGFLQRLILESAEFSQQVFWFSSLVSKGANAKTLEQQLRGLGATDVRVMPMAQGQKQSRLLAWTFLDKKQRRAWRKARWGDTPNP